MHRVLVGSSRPPDEFWVVCETVEDFAAAENAWAELVHLGLISRKDSRPQIVHFPTPRHDNDWLVIPYSHKINYALDNSEADLFVYLDNGSWPDARKYEIMAAALDENRGYDMVYCGQKRTGYQELTFPAEHPQDNGYCVLNFTQVMHRPVKARWTLDMKWARPDLADAIFWRDIRAEFGTPFFPAGKGLVLDEHHMPSSAASGL